MARKTNFENSNGKAYFRTTLLIGYTPEGKKIQKQFYGETRKEALEKKQAYIEHGEAIKQTESISSIMKTWLFDIVMLEVKPKSFARYEGFYRNYVIGSNIEHLSLDKVNIKHMQTFFTNVFKEKDSATLCKNLYMFINKFFNYQVKIKNIKENPCSDVVLPKETKVKEKIEIFTREEIEIFKNEAEKNQDYFIFYFALMTGMRQGEIIALELSDINLDDNTINVDKQANKSPIFNEDGTRTLEMQIYTPKSENSIRIIPIPPQLIPFLEKQIELQKENASVLLFTNNKGKIYTPDKLYNKYCRFLKRHNIPHRKFHTLRHTYCSILMKNNVPAKLTAELLGHDVEMTLRIYSHLSVDDKKVAINNVFANF